jgi:hypothetical protein
VAQSDGAPFFVSRHKIQRFPFKPHFEGEWLWALTVLRKF